MKFRSYGNNFWFLTKKIFFSRGDRFLGSAIQQSSPQKIFLKENFRFFLLFTRLSDRKTQKFSQNSTKLHKSTIFPGIFRTQMSHTTQNFRFFTRISRKSQKFDRNSGAKHKMNFLLNFYYFFALCVSGTFCITSSLKIWIKTNPRKAKKQKKNFSIQNSSPVCEERGEKRHTNDVWRDSSK